MLKVTVQSDNMCLRISMLLSAVILASLATTQGEITELLMPGSPTEHINQLIDNEIYEMTICTWLKIKDGTNLADQSLVSFIKDGNEVWSLGFHDENQLRLYQGAFSNAGSHQLNKTEIEMWKSWHRHCFVWVAGNALTWYSNVKETSADVRKIMQLSSSSGNIQYGSTLEVLRGLRDSSVLAGNIIGFNIWTKAMTQEEMNAPGLGCHKNSPTVNSYTLHTTSTSMRLASQTCGKIKTDWKVAFQTSGDEDSGTDAQVYFTMFGDEGKTSEFKPDNPTFNDFERGQRDEFKLSGIDIGKITHVTLHHDNTGDKPGWKLDYVEIENMNTRDKFTISCNCWISSESVKIAVSEDTWTIRVWTPDEKDAGTDAYVYMTLYGNKGESHEFQLDNSYDNFERGAIDVFSIRTSDLGDLTSIKVYRDDRGAQPGWKLQKVEAENKRTGEIYKFICNCWVETNPTTIAAPAEDWEVMVKTSDEAHASTDAYVFMTMYGDKGISHKYQLDSPENDFERGATNKFNLQSGKLGSLTKIEVYHDNSGAFPGWKLEKVMIKNLKTGTVYTFQCDCWVNAWNPTEVRLSSKA